MCIGGLRYSEQLFNFKSAGISSVLLVVSVLGAMTPTIFYECYSKLEMFCDNCEYVPDAKDLSIGCQSCHYKSKQLAKERLYTQYTYPLELMCAFVLPLAYFAGIYFSLHAHATHKLFLIALDSTGEEQTPRSPHGTQGGVGEDGPQVEENPLGHEVEDPDGGVETTETRRLSLKSENRKTLKTHIAHLPAPDKSRTEVPSFRLACGILFVTLILSFFVTDVLVQTSSPALERISFSSRTFAFLVLGILPLFPYFSSAITCAWQDQIAISIEVASSACVHICLIQIPMLVIINAIRQSLGNRHSFNFNIVFPTLYTFAAIFSVVVLNYVSLSGRVNYFEGIALLVVYLVWLSAIVCMPPHEHAY